MTSEQPAWRLQTERGNHKELLSACFDPSPMMDFIVPHCPGFRQVEQSLGACRGESSQALAKLIRRQPPRPKLSKTEPHKPRKMGKFRRIRSTPYTLPLSLFNSRERPGAGGRGAHLHFVLRQSKQNYLPASIPSVTGRLW